MDGRPSVDPRDRNKEASINVRTVGGECIDLGTRVSPVYETRRSSPTRVATDCHYVVSQTHPFALHTNQAASSFEDHVVAATLGDRPVYVNPELDCGVRDRELGDSTFLIRGEHCCRS